VKANRSAFELHNLICADSDFTLVCIACGFSRTKTDNNQVREINLRFRAQHFFMKTQKNKNEQKFKKVLVE
jgi:hypothetical protein